MKVKQPNLSVYYIHQSQCLGGAETFLKDLLTQFHSQQIDIFSYSNNPFFLQKLKKQGLRAIHIPYTTDIIGDWKGLLKSSFFLIPTLLRYIRIISSMKRNSILLLSGFPEKILCTPLAKIFNKKIIWIEFGPLDSVFIKFHGFPKFLYKLVCSLPDKIIVSSHNTYNRIKHYPGIHNKKIAVIYCGSNIHSTRYRSKTKKSNNSTIVCVSRLEEGKGQDLLIRAFHHIHKKLPHTQLKIIGTGDFLAELQRLRDSLDLQSSVHFLGRVKNVSNEIQKSTVCVFPSVWKLEGFGLGIIEAMALSTPIIAFDHPPGNELIFHNYTGLLVKSNNIRSLAFHLTNILRNPKMQKQFADNAYKLYQSKFTIKKCASKYIQIINSVLYLN